MTRAEFRQLFHAPGALIGMVHLEALPGAPLAGGAFSAVVERAVAEAETLAAAGFHGVLVENFNDVPFYPDQVPPETVAAMAVAVREVVRAVRIPVGVNVLRNDGAAALAVAAATGAAFVRVNVLTGAMLTDQGVIEGRAHDLLRLRRTLGASVPLFADLLVKHAQPLVPLPLAQAAEEMVGRGLADVLIITGAGTGKPTALKDALAVRDASPEVPLVVGSGVTSDTARSWLQAADGIIVGSDLKRDGCAAAPLEPARVTRFVREAGASEG